MTFVFVGCVAGQRCFNIITIREADRENCVPDDYQDMIDRLQCFSMIRHHDVKRYREPARDLDRLVERLQDADVVVSVRERVEFSRALLERLKNRSSNGNHPLLKLPNVQCTPHLGWGEWEKFERYFQERFEQIVKFEKGELLRLGNPTVKPRSPAAQPA